MTASKLSVERRAPSGALTPLHDKRSTLHTILTWLLRLAAGGVFLFSGIVKAVDPWGTVFKLQEYLGAMGGAWGDTFGSAAVVAAFLLCIVEAGTGAALLLGCYRRLAPAAALALMAFMLPLTLWIAVADPVSDCGCFGDALTVSNWGTFWKNVALTAACVYLFIFNRRIHPLIQPALQWLMVIGVGVYTLFIALIGYNSQPLLDFRPYPLGSPLVDATSDTDGIMAVWRNGDKTVTIPADSIPEGDGWEFAGRVEPKSSAPKEKGLAIYDEDGEEITPDIADTEGEQVLVFMYDLPGVSTSRYYKLNSLYAYCQAHDIPMAAVAAATPLQIADFRDLSLAEYPIYTAEDTALKEVVRGNPAVLYLRDGRIVWKESLRAIATDDFMHPDEAHKAGLRTYYEDEEDTFMILTIFLAGYLAVLVLVSHIPLALRVASRRRRHPSAPAAIAALMLCAGLASCSSSKDEPQPEPEQAPLRTVLIYWVGNNNLQGNADADLDEMLQGYEAATGSGEAVRARFLVYLASPRLEAPTLSKIETDKAGRAQFKTLKTYPGTETSVDPGRISEVIADAKALAPAPEYGMVMCSHSTGWLPPVTSQSKAGAQGPLYAFGNDYGKSIGVAELAAAIPDGTFSFIWMDCCLMGSVEVAYQMRHECNTYVGYPTEVLAAGAPYQLLLPIFCREELDLQKAVYAMYSYYASSVQPSLRSCTVSLTDMSKMDALARQCREVAQTGTTQIDLQGLQLYDILQSTAFYDLGQTFQRMAGTDTSLIEGLKAALNAAVPYRLATPYFLNYTIDPAHYSGLSCHPLNAPVSADKQEYYKTLDWYKAVYQTDTPQ